MSILPASLKKQVEAVLNKPVTDVKRVTGGSINKAAILNLPDLRCFIKWNDRVPDDMFPKEAEGLKLLQSVDTGLMVPEVISEGSVESEGIHFIIMDYLIEGRSSPASAEKFGKGLAALHRNSNNSFGLEYDNYIGRLPQSNTFHQSWNSFFIEERLQPQLHLASESGKLQRKDLKKFDRLFTQLPDIIPEELPALLHGDLWGGNYLYTRRGVPAVFDPAVYYGHREIELAFTHLFGGFSSRFYRSYKNSFPLEPGFKERKDIYNLYPLLVHVNLFGGGYVHQVRSIISRF